MRFTSRDLVIFLCVIVLASTANQLYTYYRHIFRYTLYTYQHYQQNDNDNYNSNSNSNSDININNNNSMQRMALGEISKASSPSSSNHNHGNNSSSNNVVVHPTPLKSEGDPREYRLLTLSNQLDVLLIHDKDTDQSAAAMDVAVGRCEVIWYDVAWCGMIRCLHLCSPLLYMMN
jgi:hypothetical protein